MCMIGDDDAWEFFSDATRRARKQYRCGECYRSIAAGEMYRYASGKYDGSICVMRQCLHCVEAARWLVVACHGYLFDAVEEDLREHVVGDEQYLRTAALTRLVRWMAADWRDRHGNLRPLEAVREVTDRAIAAYRQQYDKAVPA